MTRAIFFLSFLTLSLLAQTPTSNPEIIEMMERGQTYVGVVHNKKIWLQSENYLVEGEQVNCYVYKIKAYKAPPSCHEDVYFSPGHKMWTYKTNSPGGSVYYSSKTECNYVLQYSIDHDFPATRDYEK